MRNYVVETRNIVWQSTFIRFKPMPYETMKGYVLSNYHMMRQNNPLSKTKIKTNRLSLHALKLVEATNL